jgi:hypothetical protein
MHLWVALGTMNPPLNGGSDFLAELTCYSTGKRHPCEAPPWNVPSGVAATLRRVGQLLDGKPNPRPAKRWSSRTIANIDRVRSGTWRQFPQRPRSPDLRSHGSCSTKYSTVKLVKCSTITRSQENLRRRRDWGRQSDPLHQRMRDALEDRENKVDLGRGSPWIIFPSAVK